MNESSLRKGLHDRLWVLDIPLQYRASFADLVLNWSQKSGVEWTIERLKSLKVDLYRRQAGLRPLSWVRKNRRGDLSGCLGGLFRWADKSDKNFHKVVQCLMCYTVFKYSKPTAKQVKKFTSALSAAPPAPWGSSDSFAKAIRKTFGGQIVDRTEDVSLLVYRGSPSVRKPSLGLKSVPQDSNVLRDAEVLTSSEWGNQLISKYKGLFDPVFAGLDLHMNRTPFGFEPSYVDPRQIIGGKIAFIQEPGGKLRSVASPFLAYQRALRHFGKAIYELARHLPWDCTHDQSKPIKLLRIALEEGRTVHSVDLSSATDYFPLEIQKLCLSSLFGKIDDISLFSDISRSTWISPVGAVHWNRGQPLGLFPSFAAFAVTHGLLLWYLNNCTFNGDFFVLGDDVVILNDDLHQRYLDTLQAWGCPYSPQKSISSNEICEFAGKVITSSSTSSQFKWREISNNNFVDIVKQLGPRSRILLSEKQREVFDLIKHCSTPLGLGFSFKDSTLYDLELNTQQVFGPLKEKVLDSLVDQMSVIARNLYGNTLPSSSKLLKETSANTNAASLIVSAFDKNARLVLAKLLPWFHVEKHDPRLYSGVPGGLGNTELPIAQLLPSSCTTLDRYRLSLFGKT
jgi:hypothetical protein